MTMSNETRDRPDTWLMECLDAMDNCVETIGLEAASSCFQEYTRCASHCNGAIPRMDTKPANQQLNLKKALRRAVTKGFSFS